MSATTCIVMPGRFGDVINILPCARDVARKEGKCAIMVSEEFSTVLEGCSYCCPVVASSHFTDLQPAIELAQRMFPRVLVGKTNERNVGVTTQCESFAQESWRQMGYLNEWARLPLVFDRRDRAREADLLKRHTDGRPFVLYNFEGRSSPVKDGEAWLSRNKHVFKCRNFVDLGSIKAQRIYDLLGLMDEAECLITADTATLHLAAASGVPVVNLIQDQPTTWHGSRPRNNSIVEVRYADIADHVLSLRDVEWKWQPRTWHVWSDYKMSEDARRRHNVAAQTWGRWIDFPVPVRERVINDPMRSLPFIKDMVAEVVAAAGPRDVIVLTNADTCVAPDIATVVAALEKVAKGSLYSFRRDFESLAGPRSNTEIQSAPKYPGADFFAFTVQWWKEHGKKMPDMVLGAEAWDWCLRVLMQSTGGVEFDTLCYHEKHANLWERSEYRHSLPSQQHNLALAAPFLAQHGVRP